MSSRRLAIIGTLIVIMLVALVTCMRRKETTIGKANLTMYGLEDSAVFQPIINSYKEAHAGVTIKYKQLSSGQELEDLVINEIAEGEGPDIFYFHNTWLPRHDKKIVPLSSPDLKIKSFEETFVHIAGEDFIQPDSNDGIEKIYALPLYVDTLALYYNKSDFEHYVPERGKPALTWKDFEKDIPKFRGQQEPQNGIRSPLAIGRVDNVSHGLDLLYNFFIQNGATLYDANFKHISLGTGGSKALNYFLSFADKKHKNFSWDTIDEALKPGAKSPGEVETFMEGKVAAIAGYSDLYRTLTEALKNVKDRTKTVISIDDVGVVPLPQLNGEDPQVFANYYGLAVSRNSKNSSTAWDFIRFATSQKNARIFYQKTKRPTARRDLIEEQRKDTVTDVFISQLGFAKSLRIFSDHEFAQAFTEAVNAALKGENSSESLRKVEARLNEYLKVESPDGLYPPVKKKK